MRTFLRGRIFLPLLVAIVALHSWFSVPVYADLTGDVQGTVTDEAGGSVPGAKVTITNLQTGSVRVVFTNESGEFSAPQMEIGSYKVSIEKAGFKVFSQAAIVKSGEKTPIGAQMQ